jgi:hypothetical protein
VLSTAPRSGEGNVLLSLAAAPDWRLMYRTVLSSSFGNYREWLRAAEPGRLPGVDQPHRMLGERQLYTDWLTHATTARASKPCRYLIISLLRLLWLNGSRGPPRHELPIQFARCGLGDRCTRGAIDDRPKVHKVCNTHRSPSHRNSLTRV